MPESTTPYGIRRLILINSGMYAFSIFPIDKPLSICGENNTGKSAAVNALQFLFLADMRDMDFGKHDALTTRRFYFPKPGSYVLAEIVLPHGEFVIGAAGSGAAAQHAIKHFAYRGVFNPDDFRDHGRTLALEDLLSGLHKRNVECHRLDPHELRNLLLGIPSEKRLDLTMVPLRGHQERYIQSWLAIFKNLLHMRNVNSQDLKELLLHVFDIRLVAADIDFAAEYQRVNADVLRLADDLRTLRKISTHVERLGEHHQRRQELRGRLTAGYAEIRVRLGNWQSEYDDARAADERRLKAIEPDRDALRHRRAIVLESLKRAAGDLGTCQQWLRTYRAADEEFKLVEDMGGLVGELDQLTAQQEEVVKRIGAGERMDAARLAAELKAAESRLARLDQGLRDWDYNAWAVLSKHFKPKELRELFALLNADILHLPIGTPKGIVVDDEAAAVAAIRQLLGAIEKGVFAGPGVRIALGGLSSFDDKALRDRTFIEREREAVEKQARQLKADLEAAKGLEKLAARKQQLDKALAEKRAFRDRFERHLADRAKLSAMLTHEADQLEAQRELEAEMLGLTEQERGLDREITELRARLAGRERERQNVLRLQDDIRPPPADEPAGLPFPGPFPSELERLLEEYLYDLRDKRQIDEDIGRELEFIELAGAGAHLCETEDASIESLVESLASIPQREELYEKAKRTAIARLGSSLKGLRDNYHRLDAEVTRFNHAINQRTVSNLTMIELRLERNARVMDAIEELVKADELKLFADERRASDAARLLHDWVASDSRKLNLTHLFELCFVAFSHDGKQIVYRNLDRIESHGTTVTIKALVNMHLMGQLIEESRLGEVRIPYYLDEAASIDPRNQEILIEQGLAMGFVPVLASVKPQATATYCVRVANESGLGRLVITENDWVQLEKKPRPGGTPVA